MSAVFCFVFCALLILIDQGIKLAVIQFLKPVEYVDFIEGFLRFRYVENTGAVFGSFATHTIFLTVFSIVLLGVVIFYLCTNKNKSKFINVCLLLMISGGFGNVIDRIRLHYVVDYIEPIFMNFAVFNFADCLITVGAFALIIYLIVDLIKDFKSSKQSAADTVNEDGNT